MNFLKTIFLCLSVLLMGYLQAAKVYIPTNQQEENPDNNLSNIKQFLHAIKIIEALEGGIISQAHFIHLAYIYGWDIGSAQILYNNINLYLEE